MKNKTLHPSGLAFEELTLEEMIASQGSGDVSVQTTTPICVASAVSSADCLALSVDVSIATYSFTNSKC